MTQKPDDNTPLRCSFCDKSHKEVRKLIAGPTVYICDECIGLCNDIIAEELWPPDREQLPGLVDALRRAANIIEDSGGTIVTDKMAPRVGYLIRAARLVAEIEQRIREGIAPSPDGG